MNDGDNGGGDGNDYVNFDDNENDDPMNDGANGGGDVDDDVNVNDDENDDMALGSVEIV